MIGPLDLTFDLSVGIYLTNSPLPIDKQCLEGFFKTLRRYPASNYQNLIGTGIYIFATCSHEIEIFVRGNPGSQEGFVRNLVYIAPSTSSPTQPSP